MKKLLLFLPILLAAQTYNTVTVIPKADGTAVGDIRLRELQANGTNVLRVQGPDLLTQDILLKLPAKVWIDTSGFTAWGQAPIKNSTAEGYVVSNIDQSFHNQDNEARGSSVVVRATRNVIDEQTMGWDQFGIAGVVVLGDMNLPSDPLYGGPYIRGHQKAVVSELWYDTPTAPYTAEIGYNYLATLAMLRTGITLNQWAGLIVSPPAGWGAGGTVVNGKGIWIQNLDDASHTINSTNVKAIQIDGLGNYGKVAWVGSSLVPESSGILKFNANSVKFNESIQANTSLTNNAGYYIGSTGVIQYDTGVSKINIGNVFNITATGDIVTATGHHFDSGTGATGGYYVGGVQIIDGSGGFTLNQVTARESIMANTNLVNNAGYYMNNVGIIQYSTALGVTNIGNVYNISATGDIVTSGAGKHIDSGNGASGGYYVAGTQVIDGSRVLKNIASGAMSGSLQVNTSLTDTAGLYMNNTGIIQYSTALGATNIGNVYNISATGDIVTTGAGKHVDTGNGANGGYYISGTQIFDGSRIMKNVASGQIGGSLQVNMDGLNYGGYYVGSTGVVLYDNGTGRINIGNIYDITANAGVTANTFGATTGYYVGGFQAINSSRQWVGASIGDSYITSATTWNGKVSSVGGTSPIASSGGTTPTISCSTCITTAGGQSISGSLQVGSLRMGGSDVINSNGTFVSGGGISMNAGINATSYSISGTTGANTTLTCGSGQAVKNLTVQYGIVTAASCGTP